MLVEIRTYRLRPGVRDEFVSWFEADVQPAMEAAGMNIVGPFVSTEDDDVFVYVRTFADQAERERLSQAFYDSPIWRDVLRDRALELELGYEVHVVRTTPNGWVPSQRPR